MSNTYTNIIQQNLTSLRPFRRENFQFCTHKALRSGCLIDARILVNVSSLELNVIKRLMVTL